MSNYRAHPEEAREEFKKLIDKIASCVSLEDVEKTSTIMKVKNELVDFNSKMLREATKSVIDQICDSIDLETKLERLHELELQNTEPAWRPETGKSDILCIEGDHLRKQVKMLKKNLELLTKESSELQVVIEDQRSQILEQQKDMEKYIRCWQDEETKK